MLSARQLNAVSRQGEINNYSLLSLRWRWYKHNLRVFAIEYLSTSIAYYTKVRHAIWWYLLKQIDNKKHLRDTIQMRQNRNKWTEFRVCLATLKLNCPHICGCCVGRYHSSDMQCRFQSVRVYYSSHRSHRSQSISYSVNSCMDMHMWVPRSIFGNNDCVHSDTREHATCLQEY